MKKIIIVLLLAAFFLTCAPNLVATTNTPAVAETNGGDYGTGGG